LAQGILTDCLATGHIYRLFDEGHILRLFVTGDTYRFFGTGLNYILFGIGVLPVSLSQTIIRNCLSHGKFTDCFTEGIYVYRLDLIFIRKETVVCLGYIGFVCFTGNLFSSSTATCQNDIYQTILLLLLNSDIFSLHLF